MLSAVLNIAHQSLSKPQWQPVYCNLPLTPVIRIVARHPCAKTAIGIVDVERNMLIGASYCVLMQVAAAVACHRALRLEGTLRLLCHCRHRMIRTVRG